jgi:HEAT repeat protein
MAEVNNEAAEAAIPPLCLALSEDRIPAVRSNCAWALGQLCRKIPLGVVYTQAIDSLITALGDTDMGVQEDAKAALFKLGDARGLQAIADSESEVFL